VRLALLVQNPVQATEIHGARRWTPERLSQEVREPEPGSGLIVQQLAFMLLIQALRLHASDNHKGNAGWLLRDKKLGAALTCMHQSPEQKWTLNMLVTQAGMSRAALAKHFGKTVGITPIEYLTKWRMLLASEHLQNSGETISGSSAAPGYEPESPFRKAFKRVSAALPGKLTRTKKVLKVNRKPH